MGDANEDPKAETSSPGLHMVVVCCLFFLIRTDLVLFLALARKVPALVQAAAGSRGRAARVGILRRRGLDATAVEEAAELFHSRLHHIRRDGRSGRTPEFLGNGTEARPDSLLKVGRVNSLHAHDMKHIHGKKLVRQSARNEKLCMFS